jgi:hypothetical protein
MMLPSVWATSIVGTEVTAEMSPITIPAAWPVNSDHGK